MSDRALPPEVSVTTLTSGIRVVTEHMPSVRSVAVGFWVGCGSRHEQPAVAGATHFLEHLLFKGTDRRSAQEIAETIDRVGGDLNAFTAKEFTCFYARCLDRDLGLAVDVLGDMLVSSVIRPDDVDAERQVVLEEIRMHLDTPDDLVHSVFSEAVFGSHPLGREVLGDEATINAMGRDDVDSHYRQQYAPTNVVVAVAGNVDHDSVVAHVEEALGDWRGAAPAAPPGEDFDEPVARHLLRTRPTEQSHLILGGRGVRRGDERRHAANVLNQALGGGMASRLFQEVRERRGLAYSVFSYLSMHAEGGTFGVYAGTAPDRAASVLDVINGELERVATQGLEEEELARAQGSLTGSLVLGLEDTGSRMVRLGKALTTDTPVLSLDELTAAIDAVTVEDVSKIAGYLLRSPRTLAVVGPVEAEDGERLGSHPAVTGAAA